jgi:hypothetical protein
MDALPYICEIAEIYLPTSVVRSITKKTGSTSYALAHFDIDSAAATPIAEPPTGMFNARHLYLTMSLLGYIRPGDPISPSKFMIRGRWFFR